MARLLTMAALICTIAFGGLCHAQDIRAKTEDGRQVILKSNGTWQFSEAAKPPATPGTFQKSDAATGLFSGRGGKFSIYFDPAKWTAKKSDDPSKATFSHREGDLYAMLIAERINLPISALRDLAIKNAQAASPDVKVTREETRAVNGVNVLSLRMDGTIDGIQFTYYGYYYGGKAGSIQLITYTSQNLFQEYEPEMAEFLNGLVINEQ